MHEPAPRSLHIVMALGNNPYPRDTRVRQEALALVAAGHRVTVISPRAPDQTPRATIDGVRAMRYAAPPAARGTLSYALEFAYVTLATTLYVLLAWRERGLDVVHLHNPPDTLFVAALLPRLVGKKVVYDHHDLAPELYLAKYARPNRRVLGALRWLERISFLVADRVISVNASYRELAVRRGGVDPSRVHEVRNGPPLAQLERVEGDPALRERAGTLIGYLGHIARQDGVDHLVRALHHLADVGLTDWYAVIIGPAEEPDELERLARELGVAEKIAWLGYQEEPAWRRALATVDVCVVPDPGNPLNEHSTVIKTMEYMALGKPVVAYDLREHRVSAGEAALYADVDDPKDLARAIARLAHDREERDRLGRIGRERIRDGLAWEFSAARLVDLYHHADAW